jgi:lipoprotein-anchoring transpeptidase ErfK/SrfK
MPFSRLIALFTLIVPMLMGNLRAQGIPSTAPENGDPHHEIIVSVKDQQLLLKTDGKPEAIYPVSTSKFGIGDRLGSYATPLGKFLVRMKIGMGKPLGTVFHSRVPTGEILKPNAPGRDPIVTRILWLEGMEPGNRNAFSRGIYIHGTPQEKLLGCPASYGCIRMKSSDVAVLCDRVTTGATVRIIPDHLPEHAGFGGFLNAHRLVAANTRAPESASEKEAE